jgi:hypothetical protein
MYSTIRRTLGLAAVIVSSLSSQALAQRTNPTVDPAAVAIFEKMSAHVASQKAFKLDVVYSFDMIAGAGQTVTIDGTVQYQVRRPDRLVGRIANDLFARHYFYDGKTLTVVSPEERLFAQAPAKPTIREMLSTAATELGVVLPLSDLFDLGTDASPIKRITSAFVVGSGEINGATADHLAFRDADNDWEIWIARGDKPVPVKVTIIDLHQAERPRHSATITWTPLDDVADAAFSFTPDSDHKRIEFAKQPTTQPTTPGRRR